MRYDFIGDSTVVQRTNDDGTKTFFDIGGNHPFIRDYAEYVRAGNVVGRIDTAAPQATKPRPERPLADFISVAIRKGIVASADLPQSVLDFVEATQKETINDERSIIERAESQRSGDGAEQGI